MSSQSIFSFLEIFEIFVNKIWLFSGFPTTREFYGESYNNHSTVPLPRNITLAKIFFRQLLGYLNWQWKQRERIGFCGEYGKGDKLSECHSRILALPLR